MDRLNFELNELKSFKKSFNNLKRAYVEINDEAETFKENNKTIINTLSNIYEMAFNDSSKTRHIRNYGDLYLPLYIGLVNKYNMLIRKKISTEETKKFCLSMEQVSSTLVEHFKAKYNSMVNDDVVYDDATIKALLNSIK